MRESRVWYNLQVIQFWGWCGRNSGSLWNFR